MAAKKLCPVCGEKAVKTGDAATYGRIVLSCGDACYVRTDSKGREYWMLRPVKGKRMRHFYCSCCGGMIETSKPQDPNRDIGFGTCPACLPRIMESAVKHGYCPSIVTEEDAKKYFAKYA
jgi:hypothetical protein